MVENVLFGGQIVEEEILMDLHILKSLELENDIFSGWSVSAVSRISKQIITNTSISIFYIYITCKYYLKLFKKIEQIVCIQDYAKDFENTPGCGWNFLLVLFNVFRLH